MTNDLKKNQQDLNRQKTDQKPVQKPGQGNPMSQKIPGRDDKKDKLIKDKFKDR